ncbi:MAG: hypothetical protein ACYCW6_22630, partial [Candidatus Xenobia bacterium]
MQITLEQHFQYCAPEGHPAIHSGTIAWSSGLDEATRVLLEQRTAVVGSPPALYSRYFPLDDARVCLSQAVSAEKGHVEKPVAWLIHNLIVDAASMHQAGLGGFDFFNHPHVFLTRCLYEGGTVPKAMFQAEKEDLEAFRGLTTIANVPILASIITRALMAASGPRLLLTPPSAARGRPWMVGLQACVPRPWRAPLFVSTWETTINGGPYRWLAVPPRTTPERDDALFDFVGNRFTNAAPIAYASTLAELILKGDLSTAAAIVEEAGKAPLRDLEQDLKAAVERGKSAMTAAAPGAGKTVRKIELKRLDLPVRSTPPTAPTQAPPSKIETSRAGPRGG